MILYYLYIFKCTQINGIFDPFDELSLSADLVSSDSFDQIVFLLFYFGRNVSGMPFVAEINHQQRRSLYP